MKIKTEQLSKESLVALVDAFRPAPIVDSVILSCYRHDLAVSLNSIMAQLQAIEKQLKRKRISMKRRVELNKKCEQLLSRYEKKLKQLNELDTEKDEGKQ